MNIEPAMGSAAFLNEAINQLAEAYLNKKQEELGETIPFDKRLEELQRVKMFIADRNVYGVDLNPIAVELAEVSLWLNTIYKGAYVPWFGTQLVCGNSLIGARRQVYSTTKLEKGKWYEDAPERVMPGEKRKKPGISRVYHFLMGDLGMANYTDKVIKGLEPDNIRMINDWRKKFTEKYEEEEVKILLRLSDIIDALWDKTVELRKSVCKATSDYLCVYGQEEDDTSMHTTIREKDEIYHRMYKSEHMNNAGPYARLKCAMDYWCALWFWPIDKADLLPTRQEFFMEMGLILEGGIMSVTPTLTGQMSLLDATGNIVSNEDGHVEYFTEGSQLAIQFKAQFSDLGLVNLDDLRNRRVRLMIANQIAKQQKFQHWELEYADLFAERDGFDLIIGNPPWLLVGWNEQSLLSDKNPLFSIKNLTAVETVHQREEALKVVETRNSYYSEYESVSGMQNFLNAYQNYAILIGMKTNLFKCFLPQAWQFGNERGISAFIHPEGVYDDPLGGALREKLYERLRMHFQFANENKLFREVDHHMLYSINVYGSALQISFDSISNLYDPDTILQCYNNDQLDAIPNIKDDNGNWNLKGHPKRIIHVGKEELLNFANVFDGNGQFRRARLPVLHVQQLVEVIKLISNYDLKLQSIEKEIYATNMFDETQSQKKGIIEKNVHFPDSGIDSILSGPHIGLANPLFKASRQICKINSDYDKIDLTYISNDYKQRCNYAPATSIEEYLTKVPDINENCKYTEKYRLLSRIMLNTSGERTLISAIVPPKIGHINGLIGMCCNKNNQLAAIGSTFASLLFDFFVKITGMSNLRISTIYRMPLIYDKHLIIRYLLLNCLTENYLIMWNDCWDEEFRYDSWMKNDRRLSDKFHKLDQKLNLDMVFKTDFERREALIEIDVLVAMNLKMSLQQLKVIYQVQFPVLQSYESDTWYDQNGRIVFTNNRSLTGVGYSRQEWEAIKNVKEGVFTQIITDDTMPGGPIERIIEYVAPFDRCDREKDYEEVWHNFEERFKDKK